MKKLFSLCLLALTFSILASERPERYVELLPFVQAAPDQGETNMCLFMSSTGAVELLLNKKHNIQNPGAGAPFDLSESFLVWQRDYYDRDNPPRHFIESTVKRFNHGEAILNQHWPYSAYYEDGTDSNQSWRKHKNFYELPRIKVPKVKTELLFSRGKRWATGVLKRSDIELMKVTLARRDTPLIVNYNDDGYWHVVLIVGYDDNKQGECYEIETNCAVGSFYVRDSNGKRWELRAYEWFQQKGNAAALIELK
jgi:hypothetical protein